MEPIRAFIEYGHAVWASPARIQNHKIATTGERTPVLHQDLDAAIDLNSEDHTPTSSRPASSNPMTDKEPKILIETAFGVQIELDTHGSKVLSISCDRNLGQSSSMQQITNVTPGSTATQGTEPTAEPVKTLPTNPNGAGQYRYRLFPDWQTSYLWYDTQWLGNPKDDPAVDFEDIERRYPAISSAYLDWVDSNESRLDQLFSQNGTEDGTSAERDRRIAWQINGFLLACWLAAKIDVHSVEYMPSSIAYEVKTGSMASELQRFLDHEKDNGKG